MFECKDIAEEASNYLDGDLPLGKRIGLFLHLVLCTCCRNYMQQLKQTINAVAVIRPREKDSSDTKELAEKLRELSKTES